MWPCTACAAGLGDFVTEKFPIPAAQAVHGHIHCAYADAAPCGQFRAWSGPLFAGQRFLSPREQVALGGGGILFTQAVHRLIEKRERPVALKDSLGRGSLDEFNLVPRLDRLGIQGNRHLPAATLLALLSVPFIDQEMLEHREQERA